MKEDIGVKEGIAHQNNPSRHKKHESTSSDKKRHEARHRIEDLANEKRLAEDIDFSIGG